MRTRIAGISFTYPTSLVLQLNTSLPMVLGVSFYKHSAATVACSVARLSQNVNIYFYVTNRQLLTGGQAPGLLAYDPILSDLA